MSHSPVISIVSYTNSLPFVYGIRKYLPGIRIETDAPADCARKLMDGRADLGLIPVAALHSDRELRLVSEYGIASDGEVKTVMLFSQVPLEHISSVLLDYQSRTSILLTQLLAAKYWNINPAFLSTGPGFENEIADDRAGVVIGDRAFDLHGKYNFAYDLSDQWKQFTSLPFVYAGWAARKQPDQHFLSDFEAAVKAGTSSLQEVSEQFNLSEMQATYLKKHIHYHLDERKMQGLKKFLKESATLLSPPVEE